MSETVQVIVRCRPTNDRERKLNCRRVVEVDSKTGSCVVVNPNDDASAPPKVFKFHAAYGEDATNEQLYADIVFPIVESVTEGYHGTVFAYGQTGCGKTYTMQGSNETPEQKGIIPRAFDQLFDTFAVTDCHTKYLIHVSYLEIYKEEIVDLLRSDATNKATLDLKEKADGTVFVKDLTMLPCGSVEVCHNIMKSGCRKRSVGSTLMNEVSSRSHSIFTIHLERCDEVCGEGSRRRIRVSKLNLVDLAGSERQGKSGATGDRFKEATKINLSLSALGNVISALVDARWQHVPYRDSKLTRLLQDSLGGNTKTLMVACMSPSNNNYDETMSTLRYASRAKSIKNKPTINEDPKDAMIRKYLEEINRLKSMLDGKIENQVIMPSCKEDDDSRKMMEYEERIERANKELEMERASRLRTASEMERLKVDIEQRQAEQMKLFAEKSETEKQRLREKFESDVSDLVKELELAKRGKEQLSVEMKSMQEKFEKEMAKVDNSVLPEKIEAEKKRLKRKHEKEMSVLKKELETVKCGREQIQEQLSKLQESYEKDVRNVPVQKGTADERSAESTTKADTLQTNYVAPQTDDAIAEKTQDFVELIHAKKMAIDRSYQKQMETLNDEIARLMSIKEDIAQQLDKLNLMFDACSDKRSKEAQDTAELEQITETREKFESELENVSSLLNAMKVEKDFIFNEVEKRQTWMDDFSNQLSCLNSETFGKVPIEKESAEKILGQLSEYYKRLQGMEMDFKCAKNQVEKNRLEMKNEKNSEDTNAVKKVSKVDDDEVTMALSFLREQLMQKELEIKGKLKDQLMREEQEIKGEDCHRNQHSDQLPATTAITVGCPDLQTSDEKNQTNGEECGQAKGQQLQQLPSSQQAKFVFAEEPAEIEHLSAYPINISNAVAERLFTLQSQLVGGMSGQKDEEQQHRIEDKLRREKQHAEHKRTEFIEAASAATGHTENGLVMRANFLPDTCTIYRQRPEHPEQRSGSDVDAKPTEYIVMSRENEVLKLQNAILSQEVKDLNSEFQLDRIDFVETLRDHEREIQWYQSVLDQVLPAFRRDTSYKSLDQIRAHSDWDALNQRWVVPPVRLDRVILPRISGAFSPSSHSGSPTMSVSPPSISASDDLRSEQRYIERLKSLPDPGPLYFRQQTSRAEQLVAAALRYSPKDLRVISPRLQPMTPSKLSNSRQSDY